VVFHRKIKAENSFMGAAGFSGGSPFWRNNLIKLSRRFAKTSPTIIENAIAISYHLI